MLTSVKPPGFFYQKLSSKEKNVYNAIYHGVLKEKVRFFASTTDVNMCKVISALSDDCPDLYYVSEWNLMYNEREIWFKSQCPYMYSSHMRKEFQKKLEILANQFQIYQTDFEKELAIHNYIVTHVHFNHAELEDQRNTHQQNHNIIGPLIYGVGVCEGIAKSCQYLLQKVGVYCLLVKGKSWSFSGDIPIGHAWNIVKLNGKYYHLDISHDMCLSENSSIPNYTYFNLTDEEILCDHRFSTGDFDGIVCSSTAENYYKKYNLYFDNRQELQAALTEALSAPLLPRGYKRIVFKLSKNSLKDEELFQLISRQLFNYQYTLSASISELQRVYSITINFLQ